MANNYFQFQQFWVNQERCAMKVGTDGALLGAWAAGGSRVLDVGTGTGLLALMMAQRFRDAKVVGLEIDKDAVEQSRENVALSPFNGRIEIVNGDVREFIDTERFDSIVCNPPYFENSLECPNKQRTAARHASALGYADLMAAVKRLMSDQGEFSVVIPFDCKNRLESEAALTGFFKVRECAVRTTPKKQPRRFLLAFHKHTGELERTEGILEMAPGVRSDWYEELMKEFYL